MAQPMAAANLFTAEVFFIVSVFSIVSVVSVVSIVSIVSVYFVPSVFFIPFVFSPPFISSPLFPCAFCAAWPSGSTELWFLATQLAGFAPPRHPGSQAWPSGPRVLHPVILAPKPSRPVLRVLLPVILASDPGRAVLRVLLSGILVPDPGRAVRWPVALAAALCHIQKTTSQDFGGRKDSEYLLIVSTSGYIYVRIVWLIPGGQAQVMPVGQAPVMPAGQAPVMPAGQTWRFFQIAHTL